ncbi:hypothetical protein WB44_01365 [Synechococcus sp. WH 8020]|uniref:hypothetical protein n=1 Tax=Synechococcus sp. (strain WH8020) TaxID=32052 RepID=UPI0006526698|nr:hypothetical protein [Synechococcus sp. WH 8020]AKN59997.1 hypothetical protein WB44_01365 [Synechococcus sp. WH 8020]
MAQGEIITSIVSSFKKEPRNKIIISCSDLCGYASEELESELTPESLAKAINAFENGEANEHDERIVDAATSLCHQASNRCWGECEDEEEDEWSEVDISTEWSDYDSDNPAELFVTVYQD